MNASRSSTLTLSVLAAALIAALPVPAAAQATAAPTIQESPTDCPEGAIAQPPGAQPGALACKMAINTKGTGVAGKHAINTKGTGNNRTGSPTPGTAVVVPVSDPTSDGSSKTGHVTLNR